MGNQYWDLVLHYCKIKTRESNFISDKCESPRSYLYKSVVIPKINKMNLIHPISLRLCQMSIRFRYDIPQSYRSSP